MGGGLCQFVERPAPDAPCGRRDGRQLERDFRRAGFTRVLTRTELKALGTGANAPAALLGLFLHSQMSVAFDKIGAGVYSDELVGDAARPFRDQPMLEDMTQAALASLEAHSPKGFYLMVEGASIDKQEHIVDAERAIWDAIEFDRAVGVALDFARRTNSDADPANDTLVIVTADHETGGLALIGVGNERYAPKALGEAVRDYAAVFRFEPDQAMLDFFPNYQRDALGYPADPDPTRKLLLGWAAAPDHYENWLANRRQVSAGRQRRALRGGRQNRRGAQARDGQSGARRQSGRKRQRRPPHPGVPRHRQHRERRDGMPVETLPARHRHRGRSPVHQRPHRLGRPAVGQRPRRADLQRHLRQHGRVREDPQARGRQIADSGRRAAWQSVHFVRRHGSAVSAYPLTPPGESTLPGRPVRPAC